MRITPEEVSGLRVTVMGLGLHGGGLASTEFFARRGASVTVTDLRDEAALKPTIEKLEPYNIKYVLGRHEIADFASADLVIKNPAVRPDSPYLQAAKRVETDISIFLQLHAGPVYAVTGTKGKSTTASAIHHILRSRKSDTLLGGNITVSPLTFVAEESTATVVLELSSWQLGDLRGRGVLSPDVAVITNILHDHQNMYASMDDYIADKMVIFESQKPGQALVLNHDDPVVTASEPPEGVEKFWFSAHRLPGKLRGAFLDGPRGIYRCDEGESEIIRDLRVRGKHNRINMLCAGLVCATGGMEPKDIMSAAEGFEGVEHRLEPVAVVRGVEFYNDSAATIPDAAIAAVDAFEKDVVLICGGTDKELDFASFSRIGSGTKSIYLLEGDATDKIAAELKRGGVEFQGPYSSLEKLIDSIMDTAADGDVVVFSPGCASFGMFRNEFDRGRKFKAIIQELAT